ncbi:MAG: hypothetical protein LBK06_03150 [Planctomycetaceae bacterium]|jgi:hypothetical protein|nr:hypothetical protein [Planctomycetaceae bacterium]
MNSNLLCNGYFVPTTNSWGFIKCNLNSLVDTYRVWNVNLQDVANGTGGVRDVLERIDPINYTKAAFLETQSEWTAVFENRGIESNIIGYLSEKLRCLGVRVCICEHTYTGGLTGQCGAIQMEIFSFNLLKESRNREEVTRAIYLQVDDDDKWIFGESGNPLPFENTTIYKKRRIKERFTEELLISYCEKLGIRLLDEDFYGGHYSIFYSQYYDALQTEQTTYDQYHKTRELRYGRYQDAYQ